MNGILASWIVLASLQGGWMEKHPAIKEIITFTNDGISLEGELNIPRGANPYPLAIFIHGSGLATRNDYEEFVLPFCKAGIATFRYDKRGVGASGGTYSDVSPHNAESVFSILAADAAAAIDHLRNDTRISKNKIIIIGGSQAGWIIPKINSITSVWLSVCISGPAVTVGEEIYYSNMTEQRGYPQNEADKKLGNFQGIHGYNPVKHIKRMESPSLWLFGEKDISIPVKRSIGLLDSIRTANDIPLELKLYPDADHGIYNVFTRKREAYVDFIAEWIRRKH
jgi:dipeptidyl aminopeptidase/acylaminoacyl peptidase